MADKMLIDGLIKFCDEKSKNIKLKAEPQVFVEIRQALEELKAYKSDDFTQDLLNMGYTKGIKDGYAKGIDEFAEQLKDSLIHNYRQFLTVDTDGFEWLTTDAVGTHIDEIAEQMKGGTDNE